MGEISLHRRLPLTENQRTRFRELTEAEKKRVATVSNERLAAKTVPTLQSGRLSNPLATWIVLCKKCRTVNAIEELAVNFSIMAFQWNNDDV